MPKKKKVKKTKELIKTPITFERIRSGIPGLDKLIEGGFLKGSTTLVSGGAGTGKTIFCIQFLLEGLKNGETCMFITLEERPEDIIADVERFGWDLKKYINEKRLYLEYHDPFQITDITSPVLEKIQEHRVSRVAIDSTSVFGLYFKEPFEVRKQLFKLLTGLKEVGVTSVLTSELPEDSKTLARFGVEEYIVDGLLLLQFIGLGGKASFNMQVRKMRRTDHKKESYPFEITSKGINIIV
ncbi:MAG: RAD55 family ATPase [Candidatus Aenigmatarchaeota archaeon]